MTQEQKFIYEEIQGGVPLKMWVQGVPVDDRAREQLSEAAKLPFIFKHIAAMPDVHTGKGSTIGSVIPTKGAVIPAAVGVDIGCGMMACETNLHKDQLPKDLAPLRKAIEKFVPHGRTPGRRDPGAWHKPPTVVQEKWDELLPTFKKICAKYSHFENTNHYKHLGTLGTGNHFIEVCIDEREFVWFMLHSGSRGVGAAIGNYFMKVAQDKALAEGIELPHRDLAYFKEDDPLFTDYLEAVNWAQKYAQYNREIMMINTIAATKSMIDTPFEAYIEDAINCHHNYVSKELHFGEEIYVTRKGAVRALAGERGIIPGSMGERSFIVKGKGNPESFTSCSHGAGRLMSRTAAKQAFTLDDHKTATKGVECRKDIAVIDETPKAYKDIDAVMAAQSDIVDIMHTLKQVVCVKG